MKGNFKIENPSDVEFTLTITMTYHRWIMLREQLSNKWPSSDLYRMINRAVWAAEEKILCDGKENDLD